MVMDSIVLSHLFTKRVLCDDVAKPLAAVAWSKKIARSLVIEKNYSVKGAPLNKCCIWNKPVDSDYVLGLQF